MSDKDPDQLHDDEDEAYDEVRRLINRDRPGQKGWSDLSTESQRRLRSAAESYAEDDDPDDAARAAIRRGEREGWFR